MPRRFGRRGKWAKLKSQTQTGNRLRRAAAHGLNEYVNFAVAIFTLFTMRSSQPLRRRPRSGSFFAYPCCIPHAREIKASLDNTGTAAFSGHLKYSCYTYSILC